MNRATGETPTTAAPRHRQRTLGIVAALLAGAVLSVQAWINGRLGDALHDGVTAAAFSDGLSLTFLLLVSPFLPGFRTGVRRLAHVLSGRSTGIRLRPYHFLGGIVGGVVVLSQATSTLALGAAVYTVALVGGQTLSGLWVDHFGLGPSGAAKVTLRRAAGAVLALVAVAVPLLNSLDSHRWWVAALPFLAGTGLSWQMAVNGRLNVTARTPYPSVTLNFLLGAVVLGSALGVDIRLHGLPRHWPHDPWLYCGGLLGLLFVLTAVVIVRHVGVLVMGLAMVAGQTLGALALDATASGSRGIGLTPLLSSAVVVLATLLASHAPRERAERQPDGTSLENSAV
ncbi:DMT family transporter [Streptomyces sp. NPDC001118]